MSLPTTTQSFLSPIQRARGQPLIVARDVLASRGFASSSAVAPDALIKVAGFILAGRGEVDELVDALLEERGAS